MVQSLTPPLSRGNGDVQVLLNPALTNKFAKVTGAEANIKRYILSTAFAGYNAVYLSPP